MTCAGGYHGYWAQNLSEINIFFGSSSDLKQLTSSLHQRGMFAMFDVVANHMGIGTYSLVGSVALMLPERTESQQLLTTNSHLRSSAPLILAVPRLRRRAAPYNTLFPFNSASYFHDCSSAYCPPGCNVNDYTNLTQMEHCRLSGLLDLNQTAVMASPAGPFLLQWIVKLVQTYGVDGLRIDTVPYIYPPFWQQFQAAAGVYTGALVWCSPA